MYLFIYKTSHKNGRYYFGRHETKNLNDGYLGSGKWVKSIKNKENLSREIIHRANSIDELYKLEEYYIGLYYNDPLCMNYKRGSIGWTSKDISEMNLKNSSLGIHPSQSEKNRKSLSERQKQLAKQGNHISQTKDFKKDASIRARTLVTKQIQEGNHIGQNEKFRKDSSIRAKNLVTKQIQEGNHIFTNTLAVKDEFGNIFQIERNDERYISGKVVAITKDTVPVRDFQNNIFRVCKTDPRYLSGELVPYLKGKEQKKITCPHCGLTGGISNMLRYHFDKCKHKNCHDI